MLYSTGHAQADRAIQKVVTFFDSVFLSCYRHFLLTELTGADVEAQQAARYHLQTTPYADPMILQVSQER